jgi:hypothetical protein
LLATWTVCEIMSLGSSLTRHISQSLLYQLNFTAMRVGKPSPTKDTISTRIATASLRSAISFAAPCLPAAAIRNSPRCVVYSVNFGMRPSLTPRALARSRPSLVRPRISSRSKKKTRPTRPTRSGLSGCAPWWCRPMCRRVIGSPPA